MKLTFGLRLLFLAGAGCVVDGPATLPSFSSSSISPPELRRPSRSTSDFEGDMSRVLSMSSAAVVEGGAGDDSMMQVSTHLKVAPPVRGANCSNQISRVHRCRITTSCLQTNNVKISKVARSPKFALDDHSHHELTAARWVEKQS